MDRHTREECKDWADLVVRSPGEDRSQGQSPSQTASQVSAVEQGTKLPKLSRAPKARVQSQAGSEARAKSTRFRKASHGRPSKELWAGLRLLPQVGLNMKPVLLAANQGPNSSQLVHQPGRSYQ